MSSKDSVTVLNDLIRTSEDGEKGFSEAAELAKDANLKQLFSELSGQCKQAARELQDKVASLGGVPREGGSAAGAAHRGWVKVKSAVEDSNIAVLEEVERGQ